MTIDATAQVFAEMLYASTTESRIPWRWLAESRKGLLLLTEWERVEMFLRAINGDHNGNHRVRFLDCILRLSRSLQTANCRITR